MNGYYSVDHMMGFAHICVTHVTIPMDKCMDIISGTQFKCLIVQDATIFSGPPDQLVAVTSKLDEMKITHEKGEDESFSSLHPL